MCNVCSCNVNASCDVSIAPGTLFSATGKYRHCMRLNFSEKTEIEREQAIAKLGFYIEQ